MHVRASEKETGRGSTSVNATENDNHFVMRSGEQKADSPRMDALGKRQDGVEGKIHSLLSDECAAHDLEIREKVWSYPLAAGPAQKYSSPSAIEATPWRRGLCTGPCRSGGGSAS